MTEIEMYNKLYGFHFPWNVAYVSIEFETKSEQKQFEELCISFRYRTVSYVNRTGYEVRFYPEKKVIFNPKSIDPNFNVRVPSQNIIK